MIIYVVFIYARSKGKMTKKSKVKFLSPITIPQYMIKPTTYIALSMVLILLASCQTQLQTEPIIPKKPTCSFSKEFSCMDYQILENSITVTIKNNVGYDVTALTLEGQNCGISSKSLLLKDDELAISVPCGNNTLKSPYSGSLTINYKNPIKMAQPILELISILQICSG